LYRHRERTGGCVMCSKQQKQNVISDFLVRVVISCIVFFATKVTEHICAITLAFLVGPLTAKIVKDLSSF
jgi:hypothetical protein